MRADIQNPIYVEIQWIDLWAQVFSTLIKTNELLDISEKN